LAENTAQDLCLYVEFAQTELCPIYLIYIAIVQQNPEQALKKST
jgi:hypothetical protein